MTEYDKCRQDTIAHIEFVRSLINKICDKLAERGQTHDSTKLVQPEIDWFVKYTAKLSQLEYGTDEYRTCLAEMKPCLDHHYANSRHHSEHYPNGVSGMNLVDVVEMLCDWYAGCKRTKNGNILLSITHNQTRYGLSDDLTSILRNTAELLEL